MCPFLIIDLEKYERILVTCQKAGWCNSKPRRRDRRGKRARALANYKSNEVVYCCNSRQSYLLQARKYLANYSTVIKAQHPVCRCVPGHVNCSNCMMFNLERSYSSVCAGRDYCVFIQISYASHPTWMHVLDSYVARWLGRVPNVDVTADTVTFSLNSQSLGRICPTYPTSQRLHACRKETKRC